MKDPIKISHMKRPLSLLEVAVGMALTAILLTFLFSTFRQLVQTNASVQKIRNDRHWTYVTHLRLSQVFETVTHATFTEKKSLALVFNNGVDPEQPFCGEIGAVLFIKDEQFILKLVAFKETRLEYLYDKVKEASFLFYDQEENKWVDTWEDGELFSAIKVSINDEVFAFTIPNATRRVIYP